MPGGSVRYVLFLLLLATQPGRAQMEREEQEHRVPGRTTWEFHEATGQAPDDFKFIQFGKGAQARWRVRSQSGAPSGSKFLSQLDADPSPDRSCIAWVDGPTYGNATFDVMLRIVSGKVDRSAGLVFRFKNERTGKNYYLLRANALRGEIALYLIQDGVMRKLESRAADIPLGVWKELRVDANEDRFEVYFDNKAVFEARDASLGGWGPVGLWTHADTLADFDDLMADPMAPKR